MAVLNSLTISYYIFWYISKLSNPTLGDDTEFLYDAQLRKNPNIAKLDPGASHAYIFKRKARKCGLCILSITEVEIDLGDKSRIVPIGISRGEVEINNYKVSQDIFVISMESECEEEPTMIIGRKRLRENKPKIDWITNSVLMKREDVKHITILPRKPESKMKKITFNKILLTKLTRIMRKKRVNYL